MPDSNPYDALGRILVVGGEIATGIALAHGWTETRIVNMIERRFNPPDEQVAKDLIEFSSLGTTAAAGIDLTTVEQVVDLTEIPINAYLFGAESGGGRVLLVMDVTSPETGKVIQQRTIFPDAPSIEDILEAAYQRMNEIANESPDALEAMMEGQLDPESIRPLFIERRF